MQQRLRAYITSHPFRPEVEWREEKRGELELFSSLYVNLHDMTWLVLKSPHDMFSTIVSIT